MASKGRKQGRHTGWARAAADEWRGSVVVPDVDLELHNMIRAAKGLPAQTLAEATAEVQAYIDSGEHDRVIANLEADAAAG